MPTRLVMNTDKFFDKALEHREKSLNDKLKLSTEEYKSRAIVCDKFLMALKVILIGFLKCDTHSTA